MLISLFCNLYVCVFVWVYVCVCMCVYVCVCIMGHYSSTARSSNRPPVLSSFFVSHDFFPRAMFTLKLCSICPKVRRFLQPPTLVLNKHSQTSDQLTPATGIPSVCRDDGGLLLALASAVGLEAC